MGSHPGWSQLGITQGRKLMRLGRWEFVALIVGGSFLLAHLIPILFVGDGIPPFVKSLRTAGNEFTLKPHGTSYRAKSNEEIGTLHISKPTKLDAFSRHAETLTNLQNVTIDMQPGANPIPDVTPVVSLPNLKVLTIRGDIPQIQLARLREKKPLTHIWVSPL